MILLEGAKYTSDIGRVGDCVCNSLGLTRFPYDCLLHLVQGLVHALVERELMIRLNSLRPGAWLFFIVTLSTLGISAGYELIEWLSVEILDGDAESFLGQQGDVWDAQKDMAIALIGAIIGQFMFAKHQDRAIKIL